MNTRIIFLGAMVLLLQGCMTHPEYHYSKFFETHPRSILILPPFNESTDVEAPVLFNTTVSQPFAEKGYYVFPVFLTKDVLNDLGLSDEGLILDALPQRFKEVFGADAVLYVTVKKWVTTYLVIQSSVSVQAEYKLVDTHTGEILWERTESVESASGDGGGSIAGMLAAAVINALVVDYRPLARQTNLQVVSKESSGLPAGPYHPDYKKDYSVFNP